MEKKKFKLGLLPKLLIAIVLGIIIGQFFPVWFCRVVVTASSIFSSFLKFIIPLMIVAYVTMGIADLKSGAGKLLLITVALAYGSTLIAGSASYLVSASLFPSFMSEGALEQIAPRLTTLWPATSPSPSLRCWTPCLPWCWPSCWACACPPCAARPSVIHFIMA